MKYMGSKRRMLANGLGSVISERLNDAERFVDLFTGSGVVACYVGERHRIPVIATDLQEFATALAGGVIKRTGILDFDTWFPDWLARAVGRAERVSSAVSAAAIQNRLSIERLARLASEARVLCSNSSDEFVRAYGGWYFSPWQAQLLSALRKEIDLDQEWGVVALASLIQTASRCAASPGHTAQPFKPDTRAAPFLLEAWKRDVIAQVTTFSSELSHRHARLKGDTVTTDANAALQYLRPKDLVFIDPPYSSVHYSRFYHVLESIARGTVGPVSGTGRYPDPRLRPSSDYSIPSKAANALEALLSGIARVGAAAIITFPKGNASNGLNGDQVKAMSSRYFTIKDSVISTTFSTLGGDRLHRGARQDAEELIISLTP